MYYSPPSTQIIMSFKALASALAASKDLPDLSFQDVTSFLELVVLLKPTIARSQPSYQFTPPESLSIHVHKFLMACLGLEHESMKLAWAILRPFAWSINLTSDEELACRIKHAGLFLEHGPQQGIGQHPQPILCTAPSY
jgi:hypothetical protein